jgi:hypothetical protein
MLMTPVDPVFLLIPILLCIQPVSQIGIHARIAVSDLTQRGREVIQLVNLDLRMIS